VSRATDTAGKRPKWLMLSLFPGAPWFHSWLFSSDRIVGIEWTIARLILLGIASIPISFDAADDYSRHEAKRAAPP
jgi:hypothetical protein